MRITKTIFKDDFMFYFQGCSGITLLFLPPSFEDCYYYYLCNIYFKFPLDIPSLKILHSSALLTSLIYLSFILLDNPPVPSFYLAVVLLGDSQFMIRPVSGINALTLLLFGRFISGVLIY